MMFVSYGEVGLLDAVEWSVQKMLLLNRQLLFAKPKALIM